MTKDDLIKIAEMEGAEIDKRWSKAKIADALGIVLDAAEPEEAKLEPVSDDMAKIRVLPMGDNRIGTGDGMRKDRDGRHRKMLAKRGDFMVLPREIAEKLERKGWAEIV